MHMNAFINDTYIQDRNEEKIFKRCIVTEWEELVHILCLNI